MSLMDEILNRPSLKFAFPVALQGNKELDRRKQPCIIRLFLIEGEILRRPIRSEALSARDNLRL